jgi:flagellar biosynthesis protein FliQ
MLLTVTNPAPNLFWVLAVPVLLLALCIVLGTLIFGALTRFRRR